MSVIYKSLDFLGFPRYRIGSDGSVWSCCARNGRPKLFPWRKRKEVPDRDGYHCCNLCANNAVKRMRIHHLVLLAFIGPRPDGMQGCHNDGNRTNNAADNLRWDTAAGNQGDKVKHGNSLKGSKNGSAKLTEDQVIEIRNLYKPYSRLTSIPRLARKYGVCISAIHRIMTAKNWKHV